MLSYVFDFYGKERCEIPKLDLLQCVPLIIQHGSKYAYICDDLHQWVQQVERMVNAEEHDHKAQIQVLSLVYEFIRNVSIYLLSRLLV